MKAEEHYEIEAGGVRALDYLHNNRHVFVHIEIVRKGVCDEKCDYENDVNDGNDRHHFEHIPVEFEHLAVVIVNGAHEVTFHRLPSRAQNDSLDYFCVVAN